LDIVAGKGITKINGNCDVLPIQQNIGRVLVSGASNKTMIEGNETIVCDTIYYNETTRTGEYIIRVNKRNIDLCCLHHKVKPKINHLFKKAKNIDGVYSFGNIKTKLSLSTNVGSIIVK